MENLLAPLMFIGVFAMIFLGYPVAFALGGTSLIFAFIGISMGLFEWGLMYALPQRIFGVMSNLVLVAIPFFIFMGVVLEKSRLAEDLLTTIGKLFGTLRGGLALAVVFVGAMLAAATGVVGASVVAMAQRRADRAGRPVGHLRRLISLPIMLRYGEVRDAAGYSKTLSTGVILASGTLGQIIPPSVVSSVASTATSDRAGRPVWASPCSASSSTFEIAFIIIPLLAPAAALFLGALIPGLSLAGMYAIYVGLVAKVSPASAPALPPEVRDAAGWKLARQVLTVLMPPLVLILLVLGSIFAGIATPTEAGAVGAVGADRACRRQQAAVVEGAPGGQRVHHLAHRHGDVHPGGLDRLRAGLPRPQRRPLDRTPAHHPEFRSCRPLRAGASAC